MKLTRRTFALGAASAAASIAGGVARAEQADSRSLFGRTDWRDSFGDSGARRRLHPALAEHYARIYGPVSTEPFPIPAVDLSRIDPVFLRQEVDYPSLEPVGTIVVDPLARFLYHVGLNGRAMRYGVGVGRQGFGWSGIATINSKQEWPDWYPPQEMIDRDPLIQAQLSDLQSGRGVAGGPDNPLGCRALYLWQNNKDTLYRIHGTFEPWTIGTNVSSGCIRMINQDVMDLYQRTPVGTNVVVLGERPGPYGEAEASPPG